MVIEKRKTNNEIMRQILNNSDEKIENQENNKKMAPLREEQEKHGNNMQEQDENQENSCEEKIDYTLYQKTIQ
jgi:hypothetical protein